MEANRLLQHLPITLSRVVLHLCLMWTAVGRTGNIRDRMILWTTITYNYLAGSDLDQGN